MTGGLARTQLTRQYGKHQRVQPAKEHKVETYTLQQARRIPTGVVSENSEAAAKRYCVSVLLIPGQVADVGIDFLQSWNGRSIGSLSIGIADMELVVQSRYMNHSPQSELGCSPYTTVQLWGTNGASANQFGSIIYPQDTMKWRQLLRAGVDFSIFYGY